MKIGAKVIHSLHPVPTDLDTWVGSTRKRIRFKWLQVFSTEFRETITTSF
jgi:hypothetical protein